MKEFVVFIQNYWQYISVALVFLFEVIILVFKKRSSKSIVDNSITNQLLPLIESAENLFVSGSDKKRYVIDTYLAKHPEMKEFSELISNLIEYILTLPTKKGGLGREQIK